MNGTGGERAGPMLNPPHLGELIRESMNEVGWNVTETAARLGCERRTLSRLLNGKGGVSANMALALEALGWGTADHWRRMQASYELGRGHDGHDGHARRGERKKGQSISWQSVSSHGPDRFNPSTAPCRLQ